MPETTGPSAYNIHCCGALASLEYKAATSGSFVLQVWRAEYLAYQTTIAASGLYEYYRFLSISPNMFHLEKNTSMLYSRDDSNFVIIRGLVRGSLESTTAFISKVHTSSFVKIDMFG